MYYALVNGILNTNFYNVPFTYLKLRDLIVTLCKKLKIRNYTAMKTNYTNINIYLTNLKRKRIKQKRQKLELESVMKNGDIILFIVNDILLYLTTCMFY